MPGDAALDELSTSDAGEATVSIAGDDPKPTVQYQPWRFEGEDEGEPHQHGFRDDIEGPSTSYGMNDRCTYRSLRSSVNAIQGRGESSSKLLSASQYHQMHFSRLSLADRVHPLSHLDLGSATSPTRLPNVKSTSSGYGMSRSRLPSTTKSLPTFGKRGATAPTNVTRDRGNHASIPFGLPGNRASEVSLPGWPSRKAFSAISRGPRLRPGTSPLGGQMSYEEKQALLQARLGASMVMAEGKRTLLSAEEKSVDDQMLYIASLAEQFNAERLIAERKEAELQALTTEFETLSAAKLAWDKVVYEGGGGGVPNTEEGHASSHLTPDMLLARTHVAEEAVAEVMWQTREMDFMIERLQQEHKRDSVRATEMSREVEKINLSLVAHRKDVKRSEDTMASALSAYALVRQQMQMAAEGHKARVEARRAIETRERELERASEERATRAATVIPNMIKEELAKAELEARQRHLIEAMQEQASAKQYEEMEVVVNKLHRLQVVLGVGSVEELMAAVTNRGQRTKLVEESMRDAEARKASHTEELALNHQALFRIQYESGAPAESKLVKEDALLRELNRAERRLEASTSKYDGLSQLVAAIYGGLLALLERFDGVKLDSHKANFRAGSLLLHQVPMVDGEGRVTSAPVQQAVVGAFAAAGAAAQQLEQVPGRSLEPTRAGSVAGSRPGSVAGSDAGASRAPRTPLQRTSSGSAGSARDVQLPSTASIIASNPALAKAQQKMQAAQLLQRQSTEALRPARKPNAAPSRGQSGRSSVAYGADGRRSGASTPTRNPARLSGASSDSGGGLFSHPNMKQLGASELYEAVMACLDLLGQRMERVEWAIAHPPAAPLQTTSTGPSRWNNINKTLKRSSLSTVGAYSPMGSEQGDGAEDRDSGSALGRRKKEEPAGPTGSNLRIQPSASSENGDAAPTPSVPADSDGSDVEERGGLKRLAEQRVKKRRDEERKARIIADEPPNERKIRIDREQRNERLNRLTLGLSSLIPQ